MALVAFSHMDATIIFHSEIVIPRPQNLTGHGIPIGMCSKGSLMHLYEHLLGLLGIHTSEQNHVMVLLIQDTPTQEETDC